MTNVYMVLGDGNTRKSSTSRALTGVPQRKYVTVATTTGRIEVFVQIKSLQEAHISPATFVREVSAENYDNVLVPIWISQFVGPPPFPPGDVYVNDFLNAGWTIRQVVALGVSQLPWQLPQIAPAPHYVPASMVTPVNKIGSLIRGWWGWL